MPSEMLVRILPIAAFPHAAVEIVSKESVLAEDRNILKKIIIVILVSRNVRVLCKGSTQLKTGN